MVKGQVLAEIYSPELINAQQELLETVKTNNYSLNYTKLPKKNFANGNSQMIRSQKLKVPELFRITLR